MMPHDAGLPDPSNHLPPPLGREPHPIAGRIEPPYTTHHRTAPAGLFPAPSPPPGLNPSPDLVSLLVALRHRWISAVLLGTVLGAVAAVSAYFLLMPKNTGFAQVRVAFYEPNITMVPGSSAGDFKTLLQTTAAEIKSRGVIRSALKREEVRRHNLERREVDPIQAIYDDLTVEFRESQELLTILFAHKDPEIAKAVVRGVKDAYIEDVVESKKVAKNSKVTELEKAYEAAVDRLKAKKDSLKKTLKTLGTTDPKVWREQRLEMSSALRDAKQQQIQNGFKLIESQSILRAIDTRLKAAQAALASPAKAPAAPVRPVLSEAEEKAAREEAIEKALDADNELKLLQGRLARVQEEVDEYVTRGFRDDYVSLRGARERAARIEKLVEERKQAVSARVKVRPPAALLPQYINQLPLGPSVEELNAQREQRTQEVAALAKADEDLRKYIDTLSREMARVPTLAADYEQTAAEIARDEDILKDLGTRLERERIELRAASRITAFQDADLLRKDTKKQLLATAAAPMAAFFAVCAGLSFLEFRKRKVHSATEISRGLGIRVVGAVPRTPNLERQLVGPGGDSDLEGTPVMESIDAIRTRLLHEADVRATRTVMVTSAGHGEGKTTLAAALASSLARAGRRTLLLDGDLRRPAVHELFEASLQPGFSEVLLAEIEVAEAAQETNQDNLYLMTAGQWDREVLQALARGGLEGIFEKLAEEFDFIIVDSHPVLAATDSLLIGRQADAVILSVLREVSQRHRVYAAQQHLTGLGIRVLGAVVSGTNSEDVFAAAEAALVG